ncbi:MAG: SHOCT domain-containing protein [Gallionellaceae bacterium]
MWGYMGNGYSWGGMAFGMVSMLLFWVFLVAAVVIVIRYVWGTGISSERRQEKTAVDILKERYARGEIEREEFEQKKRDLEG